MKRRLIAFVILCLGFSLLTARAEISTNAATTNQNYPGKEVARTLSEITGVAISPLGGRSGRWNGGRPIRLKRKPSSLVCSTAVLGAALLLVAACFVKDSAGIVLPPMLKNPSTSETIEHKVSGGKGSRADAF